MYIILWKLAKEAPGIKKGSKIVVALTEETTSLRKHMKECVSELTGPKNKKKGGKEKKDQDIKYIYSKNLKKICLS